MDTDSCREVLRGQEAGAVTAELRFARPLGQGHPDGLYSESPERHPGERGGQGDHVGQQRPVEGVTAQGVAELVSQDEAQLVVVQEVQEAGVQHDLGAVDSDGGGVVRRIGLHIQRWQGLRIEGRGSLGVQPVHLGELPLCDPHAGTEQLHLDHALIQKA